MRFSWLVYIIGIIAIGIAIGFWGSYSSLTLVLLIILLLIWIFLGLVIIGNKIMTAYDQLPELTTKAIIITKKVVKKSENVPNGEDGYDVREITYHNITFETEAQNRWTFDLSEELFNALVEGDCGTLVYKESKLQERYFVGFQR